MTQERKCGDCQLCCRLLPMSAGARKEVAEMIPRMIEAGMAKLSDFQGMLLDFDKPAGKRCPHQRHHKGCTLYKRRPFGCRYWNCRWLVNDDTADMPRPDRSGYVIDLMPDFITVTPDDGGEPFNIEVVQVWVDPKHPDAHHDPHLRAYLNRRGKEGKIALIRFNERDAITLWPPSMCVDGQWHEKTGSMCSEHHRGDKLYEGLASARSIWK
jgi:hypothetical protein